MPCLLLGHAYLWAGSAVWWQEESLPCLAALPRQQSPVPGISWITVTFYQNLQCEMIQFKFNVRVLWRLWQVPPNDFTRQDMEHSHGSWVEGKCCTVTLSNSSQWLRTSHPLPATWYHSISASPGPKYTTLSLPWRLEVLTTCQKQHDLLLQNKRKNEGDTFISS